MQRKSGKIIIIASIFAIILIAGLTMLSTLAGTNTQGDVNNDGKITSSDIALIERNILGIIELTTAQFGSADINSDGKVNSTDSAYLTRYLIGSISELPTSKTTTTSTSTTAKPTQTGTNPAISINDGFETGLSNWGPRGSGDTIEKVELSTEKAHTGTKSAKVSNRTTTWHGIMANKTEDMVLGMTYNLSVWVYYEGDSYPATKNFSLQLQYNDGVEDVYKNIKTSAITKGKWTQLTGTYTLPMDAVNVNIYLETEFNSNPSSQDLMNFYIDDFVAELAELPEIEKDIDSLKQVYKEYFNVGGAAEAIELAPQPAKDLFMKHYNLLSPGNELKPDSVLDYNATISYMEKNANDETNPQVNLRAARTLLEFAQKNNIPVRGHTLVWHSQTPDWFFRVGYSKETTAKWVTKEVMLQRLENYIKNVMDLIKKTYPDLQIYAWDVVNEAIDPTTSTGMRNPGSNNVTSGNSLWMQTIGSDYVEKAFEYARKYAASNSKLYYNDYNEYEPQKMKFILDMLKPLKEKKLIDGMGMQSHWVMDYPSVAMIETAIKNYNDLGLEVQLTEIDMKNPDSSGTALKKQAIRYKAIFSKLIELKKAGMNINATIFWGTTDARSWIGGYPLLFDDKYRAKPAFYSIIGALKTPILSAYAEQNKDLFTDSPVTVSVKGSNGLTLDYDGSSNWGDGATIRMKLTNNSSSTISSWKITWTFKGSQKIDNMWGADFKQSEKSVTITAPAQNGAIRAGSSLSIGMNLSNVGFDVVPSNIVIE